MGLLAVRSQPTTSQQCAVNARSCLVLANSALEAKISQPGSRCVARCSRRQSDFPSPANSDPGR